MRAGLQNVSFRAEPKLVEQAWDLASRYGVEKQEFVAWCLMYALEAIHAAEAEEWAKFEAGDRTYEDDLLAMLREKGV